LLDERSKKWGADQFIGKLRDELLNGEIFDTLLEARVLTERWCREYNRYRPHSSLGGLTPRQFAERVKDQKTIFLTGLVFG